jgi:glycosyltransferase involved in cell wall biosynthesis
MNILIALASSSGQISGVQRHAINLARCLLTREEFSQVHLVVAPWQLEFVLEMVQDEVLKPSGRLHIHAAPIGNSALSRNWWFYKQLPKLAAQLDADIVHLAYPVPTAKGAFHCPAVVTLHDLYPFDIPGNFGFPKVLFNRAVLRQCLSAVDSIACVSQGTYARLAALDPRVAKDKASVIYNSVEAPSQFNEPQVPPAQLAGSQFLLCIAQHRRNKNILLALRVFERLLRARKTTPKTDSLRIVIVGIPGPETPAIERFIAESGLGSSITLLNGISDQQLQWCYRNCGLLFAPSVIEGFGLPVAEALLAGCRVVCSDIPAFRELGGEHCRYVSLGPEAEEAFANAIDVALHIGRPAPISLPHLSAAVIAEAYSRLYRSLLAPRAAMGVVHPSPFAVAEERRPLK